MCKYFGINSTKLKRLNTTEQIRLIKTKAGRMEDSNPLFAPVENAIMHDTFNQYIGSWAYSNADPPIGWFSNTILKKFGCLGYSEWFDEDDPQKEQEESYTRNSQERSQATWSDQCKWFYSDKFKQVIWENDKEVIDFLHNVRDIGFWVEFYSWENAKINGIEFVLPNYKKRNIESDNLPPPKKVKIM
eukprot:TRINITY_DN998_c0_g1_i1.p1 TRINITY_DN998_c0_g1~~TRINITY_DN998_c0_g1_i1.p1  ORF type:complete len:188 (-),score=39.73 TRINITY_DN998_c0_g1_i1:27-590(-)